jgi:hypothetical protein
MKLDPEESQTLTDSKQFSGFSRGSLTRHRTRSARLCAYRETTTIRILHDFDLHFFTPKLITYRLSDEQKVDRVAICPSLIDQIDLARTEAIKILHHRQQVMDLSG